MNMPEKTRVTYRYEQWRAVASGVLETAGTTFLLLIALRWFHAGSVAKALIAGGGSAGLLVSPLVVWWVGRHGWPAAVAASRLAWAGAFCFFLMAAIPVLPVFVVGSVLTMASASAMVPLLTQIYQDNYPAEQRGRLFSRTVMIRIAIAAGFSEFGGRILSREISHFQWLLLLFACAFVLAAMCLERLPSRPLSNEGGSHPLRALRFARDDALFQRTLICWMLMGTANLMMWPLRVEYLANPRHGLSLAVSTIALLIGVIPNIARLVMSPLWGLLFDRMNFFALRVVLNLGFALGILAFFTSNSMTGLIIGAVVFGISNAGGDVAWSLWVTKFAPAEKVADYMSVHTFFTGVRGVGAPLLAFPLSVHVPLVWLAVVNISLIVIASLMLLPEMKYDRKKQPAAALVEEISD